MLLIITTVAISINPYIFGWWAEAGCLERTQVCTVRTLKPNAAKNNRGLIYKA